MREPPRARFLLVVAPHPDDETIGCGGLIRRTLAQGGRVAVLVVTDGVASHRHSPSHPPAVLRARRRRETRAAVKALGLRARDLTMLALPDGGLDTLGGRGRARLARALARYAGADVVAMPDPGDAHPDHRNTARAVSPPFRNRRRLTYAVWPAPGTATPRYALPIAHHRGAKARALSRHRSQLGAITDDPTGFAIDAATRRRFLARTETFGEIR